MAFAARRGILWGVPGVFTLIHLYSPGSYCSGNRFSAGRNVMLIIFCTGLIGELAGISVPRRKQEFKYRIMMLNVEY
ncbi:hypothetical protein MgSA37_01426 [Mucilaginibacter gotjawali]|uniref:Uncharacterized protein n=2 Tax=Mucilaginibacter gotjawali TaxID=1550579 RepID=A0A839SBB0_9SPHI|nr:hypothetical protein [Mucilaginibacter gotjawali]BAU53259.1 hypothetical protein MgSA37_01426 [Mucilaginibacter gotjawali]